MAQTLRKLSVTSILGRPSSSSHQKLSQHWETMTNACTACTWALAGLGTTHGFATEEDHAGSGCGCYYPPIPGIRGHFRRKDPCRRMNLANTTRGGLHARGNSNRSWWHRTKGGVAVASP